MRGISLLSLLVFLFGITGCASLFKETDEPLGDEEARTETAIIGGLLGALAGGVVGPYRYETRSQREETEEKYNYRPAEGEDLKIEDTWVEPDAAGPGHEVQLMVTYAVMLPSPREQVLVTETREIKLGNELVGKPTVNVRRSGGTFTSRMPLVLPQDARQGTYSVYTTVELPDSKDARETSFEVR